MWIDGRRTASRSARTSSYPDFRRYLERGAATPPPRPPANRVPSLGLSSGSQSYAAIATQSANEVVPGFSGTLPSCDRFAAFPPPHCGSRSAARSRRTSCARWSPPWRSRKGDPRGFMPPTRGLRSQPTICLPRSPRMSAASIGFLPAVPGPGRPTPGQTQHRPVAGSHPVNAIRAGPPTPCLARHERRDPDATTPVTNVMAGYT